MPFQFHKGSINTEDLLTEETTSAKFQFHKGSINTDAWNLRNYFTIEFQFHKGSINTPNTSRLWKTK